ncbi:MAG TPA: 3D domain-containing protein [Bacillota bacterium]|nr:3D domain-containing protein [Bacillota bacterium]
MNSEKLESTALKREARRQRRRNKRTIWNLFIFCIILALVLYLAAVKFENQDLKQENQDLQKQVRDLTVMVTVEREALPEPARGNVTRIQSLGTFKIYHYCPCAICCGKTNGITASGAKAREGETIAVNPSVIPLGTTVIIDGHEYTAEDVGAGINGKRIDIFVGSHEEALKLGVQEAEVYIK